MPDCTGEVAMRRPTMRRLRERVNAVRRFVKRAGLETIAGLAIVTAVSACDGWSPHDTVTSPSGDPALTATISVPIVSASGETRSVPFVPFRCSSGVRFTGPLDIAMTAGQRVDLHRVIIRLGITPVS